MTLLVACSGPTCTDIGAGPSTVRVDVADPVGWRVDELCVGEVCTEGGRVEVGDDPGSYPYRLNATGPGGRVIVAEGRIETTEDRPNGPGCPPKRATGRLRLSADGSVGPG